MRPALSARGGPAPRPAAVGLAIALAASLAACSTASRPAPPVARPTSAVPLDTGARPLPNGQRLDPAGRQVDVLPMPLAMLPTPDRDALVLLGSGWRAEGVQVLDRATGRVRQTVDQASAFVGLAWAPGTDADGSRTLYTSGGNGDVVYRYRWTGGRLVRGDSLILAARKTPRTDGTRYPAGLALSPDGRRLYVAENLGDALAVVDVASGRVLQRLPTERYPYGVAATPAGRVFVSAWGGTTLSVFDPGAAGALGRVRDVRIARHPSTLLLDRAGRRLFVASTSTDRVVVLDVNTLAPLATIADPPPAAPTGVLREGSTPAALALSDDESRLYVGESDNNAVAVFALAASSAGTLLGRAPVGWYPTAVAVLGDTVYSADGKGRGTAPNPDGPQPRESLDKQGSQGPNTTLSQIGGTITALPVGALGDPARLAALGDRVTRANGWNGRRGAGLAGRVPPFEHVVYVIKENRTYDQVLGDLTQADGDPSLTFFPRANTPNHHALAERFGIYDRFFVNAEVSGDGHNWSTAAYATEYVQKTVPINYSGRGRSYDFEGTNRGFSAKDIPEDDVAEPADGYLWDLARAAGASFRNYGEFVVPDGPVSDEGTALPAGPGGRATHYRGTKAFLLTHTDTLSPGFDLDIPDQFRADRWITELREFSRTGQMPALELVRLSNDHTAGARRGSHTPRAYLADNDLALGRMVEALSRSPFWRNTVMFVVEDDAQNGPDHVDSHRAPFLAISAWSRPGAVHRWTNTTDVLATIEETLHLGRMSQFDAYARPLRDVWAASPDLRPYTVLTPSIPLEERNTAANTTPADARASAHLALDVEDAADETTFNRVLWHTIKGPGVPYPATAVRRASGHALALAAAAR
ncbi:MAG TPA: bifunctional YncE family protein/alkaline phosphatase family protein [Gemmatirosa sp.]